MFQDRADAGRQLAEALKGYKTENMIVLALPRGGVPVGYEIAKALDIPLDVLTIRKLGTPGQEELAMGAIGPDGVVVLNEEVVRLLGIPEVAIEAAIAREKKELQRRSQRFVGERPFPDLAGKVAVIVDDGLATGSTAMAAVQAVRAMEPKQIILAVPVCAADSGQRLCRLVDVFVCLEQPVHFMAVGNWYRNFNQTTDQEVVELLNSPREVDA